MKFISTTFIAAALSALSVVSSPIKRADIDDTTIFQYALTLEHLENAFYAGALAKFDHKAFTDAGLPTWARGRFAQIGVHEASHVAFLQQALGDQATKPCEYSFPYTDPKSFAALSMILEGVGTSAYLGAAKFITNKDYLTAAGSILTVEARHDAWVASAANKGAAWNEAYDTPLGLSGVFSLASQFITSCPSTNPALPVKTLSKLGLSPAAPEPGAEVTVTVDGAAPGSSHLVFFSGLNVYYSKLENGAAMIPEELDNAGTVYVAATSAESGVPTEDQLLSGLGILRFGFSSSDMQ